MSFIRATGGDPKWVDEADTGGLYVYSDGERLVYMPTREPEFVEVVMRMLDQSNVLDDDELEKVYKAFATRLNWPDAEERDYSRNVTAETAYYNLLDVWVWFDDQGMDDCAEQAQELRELIDSQK